VKGNVWAVVASFPNCRSLATCSLTILASLSKASVTHRLLASAKVTFNYNAGLTPTLLDVTDAALVQWETKSLVDLEGCVNPTDLGSVNAKQ
jgi:hypothetical protein